MQNLAYNAQQINNPTHLQPDAQPAKTNYQLDPPQALTQDLIIPVKARHGSRIPGKISRNTIINNKRCREDQK